jgi:predicted permease
MENLVADIRRAARVLRASPGLVLVSVLSLGLGLGVNLTLFTLVQAVFFYQPDIANPSRVVGVEPGNGNQWSYLNYRDLQASGIFEAVAGFRAVALNMRAGDGLERVNGLAVTPDFFDTIGVQPQLGRTFRATEAAPEQNLRLAVVSHAFWRQRLGADPAIVGRTLSLNQQPFDVIGVLPEDYRAIRPGEDPSVYVPVSALVLPTIADRGNGNALAVVGRLKPGMSSEQAQAAVTILGQQLAQTYPDVNEGMEQPARLMPLRFREFGGWQEPVFISAVMLLLVGLVLFSACANVAGLLLAKIAHRQREIAVRVAMGARRGRLIRMLLTESFGLSLLGAAAGGLLFVWLTGLLRSGVLLTRLPEVGSITLRLELDPATFLYGAALTLLTGLLCGVVPAWRATATNVVSEIKSGEGGGSTGRLWMRHAFVVGQVAVSLFLLVLSSLLIRSVAQIAAIDPGFEIDRVAVAFVNVDAERYLADGGLPLGEQVVERVEGLPGVTAATFSGILPLSSGTSAGRVQVEGLDPGAAGSRTYFNSVGPRFFETMGIPLVAGREFLPSDRATAPRVAIVSEAFARSYFPGESVLGKRVRRGDNQPYAEIVGVVGDTKNATFGEEPEPVYYDAYTQRPLISTQVRPIIIQARTDGDPTTLLPALRAAVAQIDPTVFVEVRTLQDATGAEAQIRAFGSRLVGSIGLVALLLATIGLYGMMAFVVSSRTREIGTRMALGAGAGRIFGDVLGQGLRLVVIGLGVGTLVAWLVAMALGAALAGVSPADPIAFGSAMAILLLVGAAAIYFPARRAAGLNPVQALRME